MLQQGECCEACGWVAVKDEEKCSGCIALIAPKLMKELTFTVVPNVIDLSGSSYVHPSVAKLDGKILWKARAMRFGCQCVEMRVSTASPTAALRNVQSALKREGWT